MGRATDRLVQQQALAGRRGREATTTSFLDEELVIFVRVEAQQRQLEAVLATRLAVTATAIAAELGEDRHNLVGEVDRHIVGQTGDGDLQVRLLARRIGRDDRGGSVGDRSEQPLGVNLDDVGRLAGEAHLAGMVPHLARAVDPRHEQLLAGIAPLYQQPFFGQAGLNFELGQLARITQSLWFGWFGPCALGHQQAQSERDTCLPDSEHRVFSGSGKVRFVSGSGNRCETSFAPVDSPRELVCAITRNAPPARFRVSRLLRDPSASAYSACSPASMLGIPWDHINDDLNVKSQGRYRIER